MNYFSINFTYWWLLFLLIPLLGVGLYPYFRMPAKYRRKRNKIVPTVLHSIIIFLLVLVLSGMTFQSKEVTLRSEVIILVDRSVSSESRQKQMNDYIEDTLDKAKKQSKYQVGIVVFGDDCLYVSKFNTNYDKVFNDYINSNLNIDTTATNIEAAINYTVDLFSDPKAGRIVLLSDGLQTDGSALQGARDAAQKGVKIDTLFFNTENNDPEVQVVGIETPKKLSTNKDLNILVSVQSRKKGSGTLYLYDGEIEIGKKTIAYLGKIDKYQFTYQFSEAKVAMLHAEIETDGDKIIPNNLVYTVVDIPKEQKILVIDGTGHETTKLLELLGSDFIIDVFTPQTVPTNLTVLCEYSEIIMMNVNVKNLPTSFATVLVRYVNDFGGGLFTIGGDNTYYNGNMSGTFYEQMLPVNLTLSQKNTAYMIVIDKSSSMRVNVPGTGKTRIEIAKDAASECVRNMADSDYVGVIAFARNSDVEKTVPLTTVKAKNEIINQINKIELSSGTMYYNALDMAANELKGFDKASNKHIIFISDGTPTDPQSNFEKLAETLPVTSPTMITLTTIAIGADADFNTEILKRLAEIGQGQFYKVDDVTQLASVLKKETTTEQTKYENLGTYTPIIRSYSPSVRGLTKVPNISGYTGVTAKETSSVILVTKDGDPLYAERKYGNGKVGSFMSDLNGTWTNDYFTDINGKTFIKNTIDNLLALNAGSDMIIEVEHQNYTSNLKINSLSVDEEEVITAVVKSPSGVVKDIDLDKLGLFIYNGVFSTKEAGLYEITATKRNKYGAVVSTATVFTTFSYSKEYDDFMTLDSGKTLLEGIANNCNGESLTLSNQSVLFSEDSVVITNEFNPMLIIAVIVIILFLLDLVSRKFKFKWPHEIYNKLKERKMSNE